MCHVPFSFDGLHKEHWQTKGCGSLMQSIQKRWFGKTKW